jgi:hypothetical protein
MSRNPHSLAFFFFPLAKGGKRTKRKSKFKRKPRKSEGEEQNYLILRKSHHLYSLKILRRQGRQKAIRSARAMLIAKLSLDTREQQRNCE